jgi:hypothetical protein
MPDINPYAFQNQPQMPVSPVPVQKPTSVTVFGVLNCVFGGLFFICTPAFVFFALMAGKTGHAAKPVDAMTYISLAIVVGLSLFEIATGIGLLMFIAWSRRAAIIFAVCEIIWILFNIVTSIKDISARGVDVPQGNAAFQAGYEIGYYIGHSCAMLLVIIYPVLLLIFMKTKKVKLAFAAIGG